MYFNPLTSEWVLRALIDFTHSNARQFYSSKENQLDGKGLTNVISVFWRGDFPQFAFFQYLPPSIIHGWFAWQFENQHGGHRE